jgi:hypothetical protein
MPAAEPASPFADWSLTPAALEQIVGEIAGRERAFVVELGAGSSTTILARAAGERGGRLVSVEHDADWARTVADGLERDGLGELASVVHAPLAPLPASFELEAGEEFDPPDEWYELEPIRAACAGGIDVLVVDGPPAGEAPGVLVRAPALLLADLLSPGAAVFLDDIHRSAERRAVELWSERLSTEPRTDRPARIARL